MSDSVLVAQVCMYNEVEKGNLDRCLDNLRQYCDHIVIYDDASTDNSVEVALKYTPHVIRGAVNNQMQELAHKQLVLEKSLELGATHLFWLDCDEVLDRQGTLGGLRSLCENWPDGVDAFSFRELNLWRSQTWVRTDSLFDRGRFVRLWKVTPDISFSVKDGVHLQLYPVNIKRVQEAPFGVIHYGFWDYKRMLVKIGAHHFDQKGLQECAKTNWILDERKCSCYRLPDNAYPPGCLPPDTWEQPLPRKLNSLVPFPEVPDEPALPLVDRRALAEWGWLHEGNYSGTFETILKRNKDILLNRVIDPLNRASLFKFNPDGKVIIDLACGGGWFMIDCLLNGAKKVYGIDVNGKLLDRARRSFQALGISPESYEFLNIADSPELPPADLTYSMAMFMHIPFWQAVRYFQWIRSNLKDDGEAHLQFHQTNGVSLFWDGIIGAQGDSTSTIRLDHELHRAGLAVKEKRLAEGEGILPVWQLYTCIHQELK